MNKEEIKSIYPSSTQEWRTWLEENHLTENSVWLIQHKKNSGKPTISWSESVDEALCFGWIDSVRNAIDEHSFKQYFGKRKAAGTWSKINKDKVAILIEQGLMFPAGFESIERAKQNGSWTILDTVEKGIIPNDLKKELNAIPAAMEFFLGLTKSVRKRMLQWVALAKRAEIRQKRIQEIANLAGIKRKPKQF